MTPGEIIAERHSTHGDFEQVAGVIDATSAVWEAASGPNKLSPQQAHALSMIAVKIARILCGDPKHADHWHDIAGYAELGRRACEPQEVPFQ